MMYKAILFSTDGDWVTDYSGCKTIAEVEEHLANKGSKWYFYPYEFVIADKGGMTDMNQRILSVPPYPPELTSFLNSRISTLKAYIERYGTEIAEYL